jgi:penicillin-binding protein 2
MTDDSPRIRLRVLGVVSFSLLIALVARLWFLQVLNADAYEQQAIANAVRIVKVDAPRGRIFDRNGVLLVDNRVVTTVSIDKSEFENAFSGRSKAEARKAVLTSLAVEISKSGQLMKVDEIERKLRNSEYSRIGVVPIALDVDDGLMLMVGEHPEDFPGIEVGQTTVRDYPYGPLAAHVLGYVGPINDAEYDARKTSQKGYDLNDEIGKAGIEQLFEDVLRGTPGTRVYEVDRQERVIQELNEQNTEPIPGHDIHLTIDIGLQNLVENELEQALRDARAQEKRRPTDPDITAPAGAAVVLSPKDGSVLAMASNPTYEPSNFVQGMSQEQFESLSDPANFSPILNRAIQGEYAPGSTFKPFTAYAALEKGFMGTGRLPGPGDRIDDNGVYELRPCQGEKCNWTNSTNVAGNPLKYEDINLSDAITVSSDTYFYAIGAEIGRSERDDHAIQDAAAAFGLGQSTGVQLPGERSGRVADRDLKAQLHEQAPDAFPEGGWFTGDNINAAVGQGLTVVTPLQLANAYAAFGNGGTVYAPNLVSKATDQVSGELVTPYGPRVNGTVAVPPLIRDPILQGLVGVTSQDGDHRGTAFNAFHDPVNGVDFDLRAWPVAGKTGTAEVKDAQGNSKADTALFAAFGPTFDPQYAMAVVLEQSGFGGANAAPVVAKVFDALVDSGGKLQPPLTVSEYGRCQQLLAEQAAAVAAATTSTSPSTTSSTSTTTPGATTTTSTTPPPPTVNQKPCA